MSILEQASAFIEALVVAEEAVQRQILDLIVSKLTDPLICRLLKFIKKQPLEYVAIQQKKIYDDLTDVLSRAIIQRGERIELAPGQLIYSEGEDKPKVSQRSRVFIILAGTVYTRIRALEASNYSQSHDNGQILGTELVFSKAEESSNLTYRSTAMAGSKATIIGLTLKDCRDFLIYNLKSNRKLALEWFNRCLALEDQVTLMAEIAKGLEIDLGSYEKYEEIIKQMVDEGKVREIVASIIALKRRENEANDIFLELDKRMRDLTSQLTLRERDANAQQLEVASLHELLRSFFASNSDSKGGLSQALSDSEMDTILTGLDNP